MSDRSDVLIVDATPSHRAMLIADLRADDLNEFSKSSGKPPGHIVRSLMRSSSVVRSAFIGCDLVAMIGIKPTSLVGGVGMPWLCTTNALERHQMAFLRRCKKVIADASHGYRLLRTWVDPYRPAAAQWIEWVGFELAECGTMHGSSHAFHCYEMKVYK